MPTFAFPNDGALAERLGTGLQNLLQRFNSASDLKSAVCRGGGMVYAEDLKSSDRKVVWVRVPPAAHKLKTESS